MMETLKSLATKAKSSISASLPKMQGPIVWLICGYLALIILLILSYYAAWLYNIIYKGTVVLNDLFVLIHEITGTSMVACITFIAGCFIDVNGDGVPDKFENSINNREVK